MSTLLGLHKDWHLAKRGDERRNRGRLFAPSPWRVLVYVSKPQWSRFWAYPKMKALAEVNRAP